jgi:UDP-N-acetylmuramate dehydrogenase
VREAVLELRRGKGMVIDPHDPDSVSVGSFFTNPILSPEEIDDIARRAGVRPPAFPEPDGRVKTSAAWLVEHAGFERGHGLPGPVAISTKHTLALTNRGGATTAQLLDLAHEVADGVERELGVRLEPEPVLVGAEWQATSTRQ